jgi:hypothetical protein
MCCDCNSCSEAVQFDGHYLIGYFCIHMAFPCRQRGQGARGKSLSQRPPACTQENMSVYHEYHSSVVSAKRMGQSPENRIFSKLPCYAHVHVPKVSEGALLQYFCQAQGTVFHVGVSLRPVCEVTEVIVQFP